MQREYSNELYLFMIGVFVCVYVRGFFVFSFAVNLHKTQDTAVICYFYLIISARHGSYGSSKSANALIGN